MAYRRRRRAPLDINHLPSRDYDELWLPEVGVVRVLPRTEYIHPRGGSMANRSRSAPLWSMLGGPLSDDEQFDSHRRHIHALQVRVQRLTLALNNITAHLESVTESYAEFDERLVNIVYMMLPERLALTHRVPLLPPRGDYTRLERQVELLQQRMDEYEGSLSRTRTQMTIELNEVYDRARIRRQSDRQDWDTMREVRRHEYLYSSQHRDEEPYALQGELIQAIENSSRLRTRVYQNLTEAINTDVNSRTPVNARRINQLRPLYLYNRRELHGRTFVSYPHSILRSVSLWLYRCHGFDYLHSR